MCGIAGIFSFRAAAPADRGELRAMHDALAARGPDGEGEWFSPDRRVALGHRRLAIIDLSAQGAQPMASDDGSVVITFNGEIYNWRELRRELESAGEVFRTHSDTEVLLRLYLREGEGMLAKLRGMFAFALWDARKEALLLARDPFGIKPLYWGEQDGVLRFSSQVKALLATRRVDTRPQPAGHAGFFLWGSVPAPWTLYKGVHSLQAGHLMWVGNGGCATPRAYCRIQDVLAEASASPARGSREDALDAIAHALRDSVAAHHVADVPVGVFLSSGLDSSLIAGAARGHGAPRTITLGFAEYRGTPDDEVVLAERWAGHIGAKHTTVIVRRDHFERDRGKFMQCMDQPTIDGMNSWFVAKAAHEAGLKVALSGLGGDELFASYPSFEQLPRIRDAMRPLSRVPGLGPGVRRLTGGVLRRLTSAKYASLIEYGGDLAGAYLLRRGLFLPWELDRVMDPGLAREGLEQLDTLDRLRASYEGIACDRLAVSALELSWYTRHQLLADTDWASMSQSLEVRVPMLDVQLLRTAAPWLAAHPSITKREVARRLLPDLPREILERRKTGFSVPIKEWVSGTADAHTRRGLRGWATAVYAQANARRDHSMTRRKVSLWSPGMATPGGIQSYMWRLWEMLCESPEFGQPPQGISLMDDERSLAEWPHAAGPRPLAAGRSKARYVRAALGPAGRCDLAVVGHVHHAPVALLAQVLRNIKGYAVVLHGVEVWDRLPWAQRLALRHAEVVVTTTQFTARKCAAVNGLDGSNFRVLALCADPHPSAPDPAFELEGQFPILFVGRLSSSERYKGLDTVIDALVLLEGRADVTLHVIGDGDDRPRLESLARTALGAQRVNFHGTVPDAQLQAAYRSAKVFVMPSAKEGFGIVFLEAMRHGVPCIGGAHGGTPEVFFEGREGLLVRYGDAPKLADCLEHLARDESRRREIGLAGKRRFEADYSFGAFATRWQHLLRHAPEPAYAVLLNP